MLATPPCSPARPHAHRTSATTRPESPYKDGLTSSTMPSCGCRFRLGGRSRYGFRSSRVVPSAVAGYELVGLGRTPGVRIILVDGGYIAQDRVDDLPGRFDLVLACKECRVAVHCVSQQPLVGRHC